MQWSVSALEFVPEELKSPDLCRIAVLKDGLALEFVPEDLKGLALCKAAVEDNGNALAFVPQALQEAVRKALTVTKEA